MSHMYHYIIYLPIHYVYMNLGIMAIRNIYENNW